MTFSEKIVRLRKNRGMTQEDLAASVGVSRQAVYKWESGVSYPEVSALLSIKKIFGTSIDNLLDDSYEIKEEESTRVGSKRRKRTQNSDEPEALGEITKEDGGEEKKDTFDTEAPQVKEDKPFFEEEKEKPTEKKKAGFFARLFGRK